MKQREIKFRVWDHNNKNWALFANAIDIANGSVYEIGMDWETVLHETTIQQYTGLKDKNDLEIYEGDIISFDEYPNIIFVVGWSVYEEVGWSLYSNTPNAKPKYHELEQIFNNIELYEEYSMRYFDQGVYKVLGNIFENPELLKND